MAIAAQIDLQLLRLMSAATLLVAWAYTLHGWIKYPRGAAATELGLIGFVALGLACWVIPIEHNALRIALRGLGTLVGLIAFGLCTVLAGALRNGL
jgi:hypothetical protein